MTDSFTVFAWNTHGLPLQRLVSVLTSEVKRGRPLYIVLNEVRGQEKGLARWAVEHGYRHMQEETLPDKGDGPKPEHGSTCLMLDRRAEGLEHLGDRVKAMGLPWKVFSHDRWHRPRRYQKSRDRLPGGRVKMLAAHFPTNGFSGGNRAAFAESAAKAALMLRTLAPGTLGLVVGDLNEKLPRMRVWARMVGAQIDGHNVDHCIVRGGTVKTEEVGHFGSDHRALRHHVTRSPRRRRRSSPAR